MSAIIRVENLGKRYSLGQGGAYGLNGLYSYRSLRDELTQLATLPWRLFQKRDRQPSNPFWALRDVNFEVQPGEVIAVIGRNGSGKSTLLKIISRITKPTTGLVRLRGRVGSLLEVGTGFHPELTGRENIFLNGAILGMKRAEISRKFDQIVDFAAIEQFLDTPVKRYSSGMYVRLAFAVAAHLEPEILLIDEVLAVGDIAFQRKCLGRMREVGRNGCTVLFVSHSMPAVESLCSRAVLLDAGQVVLDGPVRILVQEYNRRVLKPLAGAEAAQNNHSTAQRPTPVIHSATLLNDHGEPTNFLPLGTTFRLRVQLDAPRPLEFPNIAVGIDDALGHRLLTLQTPVSRPVLERLEGKREVECRVERFPLGPGEYWIRLGLAMAVGEIDQIERVLHFSVTDAEVFGEGRGMDTGLCVAPSQWTAGVP